MSGRVAGTPNWDMGTREDALRLYQSGYGSGSIAKMMRISEDTIKSWARRYLGGRGGSVAHRNIEKKKVVPIEESTFEYEELQLTADDIARLRRVWLVCGNASFTGKIDKFLGQIPAEVSGDIMSGDAFVFCNATRDRISILRWQGNGFCMLYKRLESGRYIWPTAHGQVVEIMTDDLQRILDYPEFITRINGGYYERKEMRIAENA